MIAIVFYLFHQGKSGNGKQSHLTNCHSFDVYSLYKTEDSESRRNPSSIVKVYLSICCLTKGISWLVNDSALIDSMTGSSAFNKCVPV